MISNMPSIGICFDIEKVGGGYYGHTCWKIFWQAIDTSQLCGSILYEGDTSSQENTFCLAIQNYDSNVIDMLKTILSKFEPFTKVSAKSMFIFDTVCMAEPLVDAGRIDAEGNLVGDAGASRSALGTVKKEKQAEMPKPKDDKSAPTRSKPASKRTENLPKVVSFQEFINLLNKRFKPKECEYADYWLTAEELSDLIEIYSNIFEVHWSEGSCGLSENMLYISLFEKAPSESRPIEFHGIFAFASPSDASQFGKDWRSVPAYAQILPVLANIQGKYHLNLSGKEGNPRSITYKKANEIQPEQFWDKICMRRESIGVPSMKTPSKVKSHSQTTTKTTKKTGISSTKITPTKKTPSKGISHSQTTTKTTKQAGISSTKITPKKKWWKFWK